MNLSGKIKQLTLMLLLVFLLIPLKAQETDPSKITIDRLFDNSLSARSFGPVYWLEGKSAYVVLEGSQDYYKGQAEFVMYDVKTGERSVMIPAWRLIPPGYTSPINIEGFSFTSNYSHVLIYTNSVSQVFGGSKGDYWVLDMLLWDWYKVGKDLPDRSLQNAKFSPDGKMVSFLFESNIYVDDLRSYNVSKLTNDGSEKYITDFH